MHSWLTTLLLTIVQGTLSSSTILNSFTETFYDANHLATKKPLENSDVFYRTLCVDPSFCLTFERGIFDFPALDS